MSVYKLKGSRSGYHGSVFMPILYMMNMSCGVCLCFLVSHVMDTCVKCIHVQLHDCAAQYRWIDLNF